MDVKLEVVVIPVADVDRAKEFYKKLGYEVFGVLDGFGPGKLYFFRKSL
jgi:catechol 2,3-dioxygenase-like lactoylglutathione lyase family enzyme